MTTNQVVECDEFIARPPADVWRALTTPELVARWWAAGDVWPVVGHRFTLDMGEWGVQSCEVLEVVEDQLLRYTFAEGRLDTTITWRLVPEGGGTRLFLRQEGFDLESALGRQALEGMEEGWPHVLRRLGDVVAGSSPDHAAG